MAFAGNTKVTTTASTAYMHVSHAIFWIKKKLYMSLTIDLTVARNPSILAASYFLVLLIYFSL